MHFVGFLRQQKIKRGQASSAGGIERHSNGMPYHSLIQHYCTTGNISLCRGWTEHHGGCATFGKQETISVDCEEAIALALQILVELFHNLHRRSVGEFVYPQQAS